MSAKSIIIVLPRILRENAKQEVYRHYMAAGVGHLAGIKQKYSDLIDFEKHRNSKSADEIIRETIERGGLVVVDE